MNRPIRAVEAGEACVPNIGERGRRRRRRNGIMWFVMGTAVAAWAAATRAEPSVLAPVFVFYALACVGWFQAKEKT